MRASAEESMKCESCGQDYPSEVSFRTETICNECYMFRLTPEQKEAINESLRQYAESQGPLLGLLGRTMGFGFVGLLVGGLLGFLIRPSVPGVGQLPFRAVITRGGNLEGLDQVLIPYAQNSFNVTMAGAIIGAAVGAIIAHLIFKKARGTLR